MWISFSTSPSISRETGIPVHLATTSAMSSSVTSSVSIEPPLGVQLGELRLLLGDGLLELGDPAVAELGGALEVAVALGPLGLAAGLLELGLGGLDRVDRALLVLPARLHLGGALAQLGELGLDRLAPLLRGRRPSPSSAPRARSRAAGSGARPRRSRSASSRSRSSAARRPRRSGRSPCRGGSGRRCSASESVAAATSAASVMRTPWWTS